MRRILLPVLALGLSMACAAMAEAPLREQFLLVDTSKQKPVTGLQFLNVSLERVGAPPRSKRAAFFEAISYEKWKTFEDEHVKFDYPDYPGITVEVISAADPKPVPVPGSPVRAGPRSFALIYRIKLDDDVTWASLSFQKADQLGFLGCFCGEVVVRTTIPHDGYLYAYSLMSTGELKYMQVLGDDWRVDLTEWTHSPVTQGMYLKLAESVRLKHPSTRTEKEWRDSILNDSTSDYERLGWLRRGMKAEEVRALMGPPARQSDSALEYERVSRENQKIFWKRTIRVPMSDGAFRGFDADSWKDEEIPPERGSLRWAREQARRFNNMSESERKKHGKEIKHDAPLALEMFQKTAAEAKEQEWYDWCHVVTTLAEVGFRDARVIPVIQQRFLSAEDTMADAATILKQYEVAGREKLYLDRLRMILTNAANARANSEPSWAVNDVYNLVSLLSSPKARVPWVREGLAHRNASVRGDAMAFVNVLPAEEARLAARGGVTDADTRVRANAARALAKGLANAADTPLLEASLSKEDDKYVREQLEKARARSKRR